LVWVRILDTSHLNGLVWVWFKYPLMRGFLLKFRTKGTAMFWLKKG
jgi:hypothetical protein